MRYAISINIFIVSNVSNTECIQGWIEVLHFKSDPTELYAAEPPILNAGSLLNFKENHYELVGSTIPLCEYYSAFELYQQLSEPIDEEFGIPRCFREYDAINLCVNDAKFGRKITTLVVWPKGQQHKLEFREQRVQYHPKYPHCLVIRKKPFKSFYKIK